MSGKIDISDIVHDHFKSLRNYRSEKMSKIDLFTFYFFPIAVGIVLAICISPPSETVLSSLATGYAIFAGLLLNLLVIIFTVRRSVLDKESNKEIRKNLLDLMREIFANVSYQILICGFAIVVLIVSMYLKDGNSIPLISVVYGVSLHFILTFLMILKRIYRLLRIQFRT